MLAPVAQRLQQGLAPRIVGRFGGQCIELLPVLGQVEFAQPAVAEQALAAVIRQRWRSAGARLPGWLRAR